MLGLPDPKQYVPCFVGQHAVPAGERSPASGISVGSPASLACRLTGRSRPSFPAHRHAARLGQDGVVQAETSWWVFDRPIVRDWLFVAGVIVGVLSMFRTLVQRGRFGATALVLTVVLAIPSGILAAGVFGGTAREFVRGRRGASR
jgi:hypothetical protein